MRSVQEMTDEELEAELRFLQSFPVPLRDGRKNKAAISRENSGIEVHRGRKSAIDDEDIFSD